MIDCGARVALALGGTHIPAFDCVGGMICRTYVESAPV
jgi:hypothetical protein